MLRIAIQMDPLHQTYPGETTHYIGREAHRRGHAIFHYTPADLFYRTPAVMATVRSLAYTHDAPDGPFPPARGVALGCELGAPATVDLAMMDVILLRQDPPFDLEYLTTTYLLERVSPTTLVINDPRAVRDISEKLSILQFPELAPPTLVTSNETRIREFRAEHGELVVKPLYGKGGDGMFFIGHDDKNANAIIETVLARGEPVMVQRYIADTSKKVVIVDGEICGALLITPEPDEVRGNLDRGKSVHRTELTDAERVTASRVARYLGDRGIVFAGIDLVGPYLLENNVTSPGALFYFNPLHDARLETAIVDVIERRAAAR